MSILTMKLLQPYMAENDGAGGDAGGGSTDRGDNLANAAGTAANAAAAAAAQADEDLKNIQGDEGDDKAKGGDDEQARDANGKFAKKHDDARIPKDRFDEAVNKERSAREAAEARLAEAQAKLKQEEKNADVEKMEADIEKLEAQHTKLILDGEHEKAAAVMEQIRHSERQIAKLESDEKVATATSQAVEQVRMDAAIAKLESDHPQFNPDSEDFDQDLVDIVLAEQGRLMRTQGMSPSKALTNAAAKIMSKFAPVGKDKDTAKGLGAAKGAEDRKAAQVKKNLETAAAQPASTKEAGLDSDKVGAKAAGDVSKMTADEFAALPESTKAKLRGDFI